MAGTHPGDLTGLKIQILGKLTAVDMTTAAVFNVFNNGPNQCLLTHVTFGNFSAFPTGISLPGTWAFSYGTAPTTAAAPAAPANLQSSGSMSGKAPYLLAQAMTNTSAYIAAFYTLYFAVVTTTNGVGTFDAVFYGGVLGK